MKYFVICHTHWDREWFAPFSFTRSLLPGFFEKLFEILEEDSSYCFVCDGQTLMLEDLQAEVGSDRSRFFLERLKRFSDRVDIGPYYGQIDWRIAEESAIRNIEVGLKKAKSYVENPMKVGWLLDNFGFSSQVPQIHRFFGIDTLFLWRGVDFPNGCLPKTEFFWESPDGSRVLAVFALDSYRNLMRICDFPEVAEKRLKMLVERLKPFSPSGILPIFDGYDLDPEPENPAAILDVDVVMPQKFADEARVKNVPRDVLQGEMNSGRLVCVFPGTLSTRQQLKLMNWTCEWALSKIVEPLAALAMLGSGSEMDFEEEWSLVLQNLIHDSISGVSVDEVHREMEERYRQVLESIENKITHLLPRAGRVLPNGVVVFNTNPYTSEGVFFREGRLFWFTAPGGSIAPVDLHSEEVVCENKEAESFQWENEHFSFELANGSMNIVREGTRAELLPLVLVDDGDAYSADLKNPVPMTFDSMYIQWRTTTASSVRARYTSEFADITVDLLFTHRPVLEMKVHLSGKGSGYALAILLKVFSGDRGIVVNMPFDRLKRPEQIIYPEPSSEVLPLLVAARETGANYVFPFKDLAGLRAGKEFFGVLAKGVYSYVSFPGEGIAPVLIRSVEWISKKHVEGRVGDAGPVMYVPGASMKRKISLDLAFYAGSYEFLDIWANAYLNPPMLFNVRGSGGSGLSFYRGNNVVFSTMKPFEGKILCRFYNPHEESGWLEFSDQVLEVKEMTSYDELNVVGKMVQVPPKTVKSFLLTFKPVDTHGVSDVELLYPEISWNVGEEKIEADPRVLKEMHHHAVELEAEGRRFLQLVDGKEGIEKYKLLFEAYKRLREALELRLSIAQNEGAKREECMKIARELNEMRVKRRSIELMLSVFKQNGGGGIGSSS